MSNKERKSKLEAVIKELYFDAIDDYFDAKDRLLFDLNEVLKADKYPLCYKKGIEEALAKSESAF